MLRVLDGYTTQDRQELTGWYAKEGLQLEREFLHMLFYADREARHIGIKMTEKEIGNIMKVFAGIPEFEPDIKPKIGKKTYRAKVI